MTEQHTDFVRVTVVGPDREADLALPTGRPIAELRILLERYLGGEAGDRRLLRLGQEPMADDRPLADYDVRDGEVLHLVSETRVPPAAVVDDIVEMVEQAPSAAGGEWTPRATRTALRIAGATFVASGAPVLAIAGGGDPLALAIAGAIVVVAAVALRLLREAHAGEAVAWAGVPFWSLAAWAALEATALPLRVAGVAAATTVALVVVGVLAVRTTPVAAAPAAAMLTVAAATFASWRLGASAGQVAGVVAVVWLVGVVLLPSIVVAASGLSARLGRAAAIDPVRAGAEVVRARLLTLAMTVTAAAVLAVATAVLGTSGDRFGVALAAVVATLTALRARRFAAIAERAVLLAAATVGIVTCVLAGVLSVETLASRSALVAGVIGVGVGLLVLSRRTGASGSSDRLATTLDRLESLVALAVAPLLAGLLGLYSAAEAFGRTV